MNTKPNHLIDCFNILDFVDSSPEVIPVVVQEAIYRLCGELERYDRGLVLEYPTGEWPEMTFANNEIE